MDFELVLATTNIGKLKEIEKLLADLPFNVICHSLGKMEIQDHPVEDGSTFKENAIIKANHYSQKIPGYYVVAEDSGLEVAALAGEPGVHSARYAGEGSDDDSNIEKLLANLNANPNRQARFITVVALAVDGRIVETFSGAVIGVITQESVGTEGFGYDPVFFYPPLQKTFAQLTAEEKNRISHRFQAFQKVKEYMKHNFSPESGQL